MKEKERTYTGPWATPIPIIPLSRGERRVLQMIVDAGDEEELTQALPGGWWLGTEKISPKIGAGLLRKILISVTYHSAREDYFIYRINEWGRAALQNCKSARKQKRIE